MNDIGSSNTSVYLMLGAVVVATLAYKGYFGQLLRAMRPVPSQANGTATLAVGPTPRQLTSHELIALATSAAKREAEAELGELIAKKTATELKATFTAPFSSPVPAGPEAGDPAK